MKRARESPTTCKMFVGGLSQSTDSNRLVKYFEGRYAPHRVASAVVMYDNSTGRSRGFGFVTMDVGVVVDIIEAQRRDPRRGAASKPSTPAGPPDPRALAGRDAARRERAARAVARAAASRCCAAPPRSSSSDDLLLGAPPRPPPAYGGDYGGGYGGGFGAPPPPPHGGFGPPYHHPPSWRTSWGAPPPAAGLRAAGAPPRRPDPVPESPAAAAALATMRAIEIGLKRARARRARARARARRARAPGLQAWLGEQAVDAEAAALLRGSSSDVQLAVMGEGAVHGVNLAALRSRACVLRLSRSSPTPARSRDHSSKLMRLTAGGRFGYGAMRTSSDPRS
ncbi:RNA binding protein [Aureococcus anophagefferens]|uniref:RNA binding protein n=1 Tax=Aureococcus anophagefferens TaxID=44056 RepID=A0ABR1FGH7_AURAN